MTKMAAKPRRLIIERRSARSTKLSPGLGEIFFVDLEADEVIHAAALRGNRGVSNAKKWIEHRLDAADAMELDAPFRQLLWKGCRMRTFFRAPLNRLVRNKPRVSPAAPVLAASMAPPGDIALVRIRNTQSQALDRRLSFGREMENI